MRRLFVILAFAASACSGTASKESTASTHGTQDTPVAEASAPGQEFVDFWPAFRAALLASDFERAAAMTQFPLEVRGELDADPVTRIDRRAFDDALRRMLKQDSGARAGGETVTAFLKRYPQPSSTDVTPDTGSARVGDFEFEHLDTEWRLVRIYLQGEHRDDLAAQ